jgi:hypothetical protein
VGAPSDVFSLGVMLYQLCTGHLPYSGKDPLTVITAILRGQYRRPSEIEPRVGPDIEKVIVRCLQADAAARFPDGTAVAQALRGALGDTRMVAHLEDEEAALRRFFDDPGAFEAALAVPVAQVASEAAERARKSRHLPRALAELGRALAYDPDHAEARTLLARLNVQRGRPGVRFALLAGFVLLAGGAFVTWRQRPGPQGQAMTRPLALPAAAAPSTAVAKAAPSAAVSTIAARSLPEAPAPRAARVDARRKEGASPRRRASAPAAAKAEISRQAPSPVEAPGIAAGPRPPNPAHGETSGLVPTTPPASGGPTTGQPAAKAPVAAKASVSLRASYGFCEPSLDGQPASLRANYSGLQPGPHEVYCTLPEGGPKLHVATYELPPGARASVVIIPGPDGRPIIGRAE